MICLPVPIQQHMQPCLRTPTRKTPIWFTTMGGSSRTNTLHVPPPPPCLQPLVVFWAHHNERLHGPSELKRHIVQLSLCVFMFHPNQSIGREWDSLPAEFSVPKCSLGTVKAVICIPQFPSAEQSWSILNTPLPSSPAVCSLLLPLSHWFMLHVCINWKAIRGRAPWQWFQVLLPDYCSGSGEEMCLYIYMHVCVHGCRWHARSFPNWYLANSVWESFCSLVLPKNTNY